MELNFFDEKGILGENETILLRQIQEEEYALFGQVLSEGKNNKDEFSQQEMLKKLKKLRHYLKIMK